MTTRSFFARPPVALRAGVLAVATAFPVTTLAVPAATVEFVVGDAVAVSKASGQSRSLTKGAPVENGDRIFTNKGRVQLRFTDQAYVSLQPQSEFAIDDYQFNGKTDGTERGFFSLLKGGLRTITGLVGRTNRRNYQVTTTVATIGIRGTEYTIAYTNSITGTVGGGELNVCNGVGCVPFGTGQSFLVTDRSTRPVLTSQKTDLPPQQPTQPTPSFVSGDQVNSVGLSRAVCDVAPELCAQLAGTTTPQPTTPEPTPPLLTGTQNHAVALAGNSYYASVSPNSQLLSGASTLDASGLLVSFTAGGLNTMSGGTYAQTGNNGTLAWGNFSGGTISGGDYAGTLTGGGALFYIVGLPTVTLPATGVYTYTPVAGSLGNAGGATLTSASLTLTISAGATANLSLGLNAPSIGAFTATGTGAVTGGKFAISSLSISTSCVSCIGHADGFFAGANASQAGVSYVIKNGAPGPMAGAIAFKQP